MYLGLALFREERYRPRRWKRTEWGNTGSITYDQGTEIGWYGKLKIFTLSFSKTAEFLWRTEISRIYWGKARQNLDCKFEALGRLSSPSDGLSRRPGTLGTSGVLTKVPSTVL